MRLSTVTGTISLGNLSQQISELAKARCYGGTCNSRVKTENNTTNSFQFSLG